KRVVFIFDTSGSMNTPHFSQYKDFLNGWILSLPFEHFTVLEFSTDVHAWTDRDLKPGTEEHRRAAAAFVDAFRADGATNTLAAFQKAFQYPGIDCIVLFSDGAPTKMRNG